MNGTHPAASRLARVEVGGLIARVADVDGDP